MHEIHITQYMNGHMPSVDCWCEPNVDWFTNEKKQKIALIRHVDYVPLDHVKVQTFRNTNPDWITQLLETVKGE